MSHSLSLSLLSVSAEKKLVEQAQKPVALAPIRVDSRRTRPHLMLDGIRDNRFLHRRLLCVGISTSRTDKIETRTYNLAALARLLRSCGTVHYPT